MNRACRTPNCERKNMNPSVLPSNTLTTYLKRCAQNIKDAVRKNMFIRLLPRDTGCNFSLVARSAPCPSSCLHIISHISQWSSAPLFSFLTLQAGPLVLLKQPEEPGLSCRVAHHLVGWLSMLHAVSTHHTTPCDSTMGQ
jgi:hypothetical protein